MYTNNNLHNINITNGSTGIVKVIKFSPAELKPDGFLKGPCLPDYVWVDFANDYTGESFSLTIQVIVVGYLYTRLLP